MRNLLQLSSAILVLFSVVVSFVIGILVARLTGAGEGQMLASGAIVFFYGVVGAGIGLILSLFIAASPNRKVVKKLNRVLGVLFVAVICFIGYRWMTREVKEDIEIKPKPTAPASEKADVLQGSLALVDQDAEQPMGIGFFKPNFYEYPSLYFYGGVNLEKSVMDHSPQDSLVLARDEVEGMITTYAPPWLYPEHMKLDYGIMFFKVLGVGHDFVEVVGNKANGQKTYLDKNKGSFMSWPEFLLSINSVEFSGASDQKVFVKPLDHAGEVSATFEFMIPLLIEDEWMKVKLVDGNFKEQGRGWIRWKKGTTLLVVYSLLS